MVLAMFRSPRTMSLKPLTTVNCSWMAISALVGLRANPLKRPAASRLILNVSMLCVVEKVLSSRSNSPFKLTCGISFETRVR